ncbi:MAG: hypothetical protein QW245_02510 [Ignisphaera sp.]
MPRLLDILRDDETICYSLILEIMNMVRGGVYLKNTILKVCYSRV